MDRILQLFCDFLADLGVATEVLQQEFLQGLDTYSQEDQKILSDQFISQIKIAFKNPTEDTQTQTNSEEPPNKRTKTEHTNDAPLLNRDNVQITASKEELEKRIAAYIALKANENCESNLREFTKPGDGGSRTDPAAIKRKQQIKLSKNESQEGPLNTTHSNASNEAKNIHAHIFICFILLLKHNFYFEHNYDYFDIFENIKLPWGVEQRLQNLEHFTDTIPPTPPDVYKRLKKLEERVLLLEDTGFLEYLDQREGRADKYSQPPVKDHSLSLSSFTPSSPSSSSPSPSPSSPQVDTNKRIAELMATLQKKSEQTTTNSNTKS